MLTQAHLGLHPRELELQLAIVVRWRDGRTVVASVQVQTPC